MPTVGIGQDSKVKNHCILCIAIYDGITYLIMHLVCLINENCAYLAGLRWPLW